jgi:hypothetical protein
MAEFLVLAYEPQIPEPAMTGDRKADDNSRLTYDSRLRKGDIIAVRGDGAAWGTSECLPSYHVVKVPGLEAEPKYEIFLWDGNRDQIAAQRKYAVAVRDGWGSTVELTADAFFAVLITKTGV